MVTEADGQDGMGSTAVDHAQMVSDTDNSGKENRKKAVGGKGKRSAAKQSPQSLDTSSLLKKRDQRNQL